MSLPAVVALEGVARHYAWGSRTAIPQLLGIPADGRPVAELWFGAHPDAPARVPSLGTTLDAVIAAEPVALLGDDVIARFGTSLPFLVKVLAADSALSLQVHPTRAQAQAGYAAEEAQGIPREVPERNYRDRNHKPELLCALTQFDALCGFRPVAETLGLLDVLDLAELAPIRALLAGSDGLRAAFTALVAEPVPARLAAAVVQRLGRLAGHPEWAEAARAVAIGAADFPGDAGVVLALLLNPVRLQPGEAMYLAAGTVHSYLRGMGVEVMAASDNVLRCGLTGKHVDVPELLKVTEFAALRQPRCPGGADGAFAAPVADFAVAVVELDGSCPVSGAGPHVVLNTNGAVEVEALGARVLLLAGQAAFVAARESAFALRGTGRVVLATVGSR